MVDAYSEQVDIEIRLSGTFWDHAPFAKVWLDEIMLHDGPIGAQHSVKWSAPIPSGAHEIKVELYRKQPSDTIVEDGKIVQDQLLNIDEILVDEIPLGYLLHQNSTYVTESGETIKNCVNLGINGVWTFPISVPIYVWLLENF